MWLGFVFGCVGKFDPVADCDDEIACRGSSRYRYPADIARPRRRGDRITPLLVAAAYDIAVAAYSGALTPAAIIGQRRGQNERAPGGEPSGPDQVSASFRRSPNVRVFPFVVIFLGPRKQP